MVLKLMRKRRSIRRFTPEPLSKETLVKLVEAAITAPSASNKQPWRFLIVRDRDSIESAARVVDEERWRLIDMLSPEFRDDFKDYSRSFTLFRYAPALIVPLYRAFSGLSGMLDREKTDEKHMSFQQALESHSALISISTAIQNILLMAEELEIGACCMTGPLIAKHGLEKILKVPQGWQIAALIATGRPDEQPDDPGRKHLKSFVRWL